MWISVSGTDKVVALAYSLQTGSKMMPQLMKSTVTLLDRA